MTLVNNVVAEAWARLKVMGLRSWKEAFNMKKFALDFTPKVWTVSPNHPHDHLYVDCAVPATWSDFEMKTAFDVSRTDNIPILPSKCKNWPFRQSDSADWILVILPEGAVYPTVLGTTPGVVNDFMAFMEMGLAALRSYVGS